MKKNSASVLFFLIAQNWRYAPERRLHILADYALLTVAYIILSLQPVVLGQIINAAQSDGGDALRHALGWSVGYGGTIIGFWLFNWPARVMERHSAFIAYHNFVRSLYRKVTEMPLRWHQNHHSGDTINRINKAGGALHGFAAGQFILFNIGVRFATSLVALGFYSWWITVVSMLSSLVVMTIIGFFDGKLIPMIEATNKRDHHMQAAVHDYVGNIVTVLALRLQKNTTDEISHRFQAMKPSLWREIKTGETKWACVAFVLILTQAGIVASYIALNFDGRHLALGNVAAIFQCLLTVNLIFFQSLQTLEALMRQHTDMRGIDGLLQDHARLAVPVTALRDKGQGWKQLTITGLNFTHHEGIDRLHHLRAIALSIRAGQKIALIGGSGSGKTTLLNLLRGLYETQTVTLDIDGRTTDDLSPLAAFTTLIPQDTEIFENTILYNLTFGTEAPDEIIQQALFITTFDEVLGQLPNGMETDIRERGVNLSGGQKQRLALARGLIAARDSSLLLMDEPTSSVDLPTEGKIIDRLFTLFADKAMIASVHRLHLLPRFDHIILMQDGKIAEQGSFDALLAQRRVFAHLWDSHLRDARVG